MPADDVSLSIGSTTPIIVLNEDSFVSVHSFRSTNNNNNNSNNKNNATSPDKRSSGSIYCRICHEDSSHEELIDPCECSGTLALIHASCLEKWLSTSNTERCEICKHDFYIQRKNKTILESLWQWWKSRSAHGARGIAGDAICLVVLTPLCIAATYLCGIGASAYTRLGFWEGTGLAVLCCMLVATYFLWLVVTLRFHYQSWREWRRRNQDIKLLVKHRSDEEKKSVRLMIRNYRQDRNNNNNNNSISERSPRGLTRFASYFGMYFNTSNDPFFAVQQTTFV